MFLFRVGASFATRPLEPDPNDLALGAWDGVAPDAVAASRTTHAVAGIATWVVLDSDRTTTPLRHQDGDLLIAGDVRLHNRDELVAALGLAKREIENDLEIVLHAFLRWSLDVPTRLVGDFAFAIWSERDRRLFAARDHLGIRPLYHCAVGDVLWVASDVRQLLPQLEERRRAVNPDRVLDRLTHRYRRHGQSYFHDISILRPGHCVTASSTSVVEKRYWYPDVAPSESTYDETCEQLHSTFVRAVEDRLQSDRPVVAHLSGGFDSTTIVMAAQLLHERRRGLPDVITASATAPGFECDDFEYAEATRARTTFESFQWSAIGAPLSFEVRLAAPVLRSGLGGGPLADFELAHRRRAGALLSGFGGDEVKFAGGIFRDAVRHFRLRTLLRDPAFRRELKGSWRAIPRASLGVLPPRTALKLLAWHGTRSKQRPGWLGPALLARWPRGSEHLEIPRSPFHSHVEADLFSRLTRPHLSQLIDSTVLGATNEGVEMRLPYLDVRLVERLLQVPWEQRVPAGDLRRLGRQALQDLLPPELSRRKGQGSWKQVWAENSRAMLPAARQLIEDGKWHSAPYVDRQAARDLLFRVDARGRDGDPDEAIEVVSLAAFEAWLSAIFRYDSGPQVR
jgi:asparagine synthase (glutamine-hydrolysing)